MLIHVTEITHVIGAIAFFAVCVLLSVSRAQHRYKRLLLIAGGATVLWAISAFVGAMLSSNQNLIPVTAALEQVRTVAWMAVVAFVMFVAYPKRVDRSIQTAVMGAVTRARAWCFRCSM